MSAGFLWALERKGIRFYSVGGASAGAVLAAGLASTGSIDQPKMDNLLAALLHNLNFAEVTNVDDAVKPTSRDAAKLKTSLPKLQRRWRKAAAMALHAHRLYASTSGAVSDDEDDSEDQAADSDDQENDDHQPRTAQSQAQGFAEQQRLQADSALALERNPAGRTQASESRRRQSAAHSAGLASGAASEAEADSPRLQTRAQQGRTRSLSESEEADSDASSSSADSDEAGESAGHGFWQFFANILGFSRWLRTIFLLKKHRQRLQVGETEAGRRSE